MLLIILIIISLIALKLLLDFSHSSHRNHQNRKREKTSTSTSTKQMVTNRKIAIFDENTYEFDASKSLIKNDSLTQQEKLKSILKEIVSGHPQKHLIVQTFYSHDEFDKFTFINTGTYTVEKLQIEQKLMKTTGTYKITFPFAIALSYNDWDLIESHQLSEFFQNVSFTSLNHTETSEKAWYYIYQHDLYKHKLMKYRSISKISQPTIDKFVSLILFSQLLKERGFDYVDFKEMIDDLQDNDLFESTHLSDFRETLDEIVMKLYQKLT